MADSIERRSVQITDLRTVRSEDDKPRIVGYAAVFNKMSEDLGGFREKIAPGAFAGALKNSDTRMLWNHDSNMVLGRVSAGTLDVKEDRSGLKIENTPPDTQWAKDLMVSIDRGDIKDMSFGFHTKKDEWDETKTGTVRTLLEIDELPDVSPVTFPAYKDTKLALRSMEAWKETNKPPGATPKGEQDDPTATSRVSNLRRRLDLKLKTLDIEEADNG